MAQLICTTKINSSTGVASISYTWEEEEGKPSISGISLLWLSTSGLVNEPLCLKVGDIIAVGFLTLLIVEKKADMIFVRRLLQ